MVLTALLQQAVNLLPPQPYDIVVVFAVTFLLAYICCNVGGKGHQSTSAESFRRPPCLKSLPVVGSIPYLTGYKELHKFFLSKLPTMGPVIGFTIFSRRIVVLQTREAIAEAFSKVEISNRPSQLFEDKRFRWARKGIIAMPYTAEFKKYHQLTLTILKQFGFGKFGGVMEARIHHEVTDMIAAFDATQCQPVDPENIVDTSVMNVIASILFGKRYDRQDPELHRFISKISQFVDTATINIPVSSVPSLRYIPPFRRALDEFEELLRWFHDAFRLKIAACENDEDETPCFIRSFIEAEDNRETYDEIQLTRTLHDLMLGGSDTGSTTLRWSIVLLANHPDVQSRLQKEIDSVVPRERLPSLNDRLQLPFVEAFILEVMRYKTITPLGLPHETNSDTMVRGFHLQTDTLVMANIHAVHMDPNVWGDPRTFRPDRFIDRVGKLVNREKVIPFSIGKRSCLGELLARQEAYLFLTGLLQKFTVLPPDGCNSIECDEVVRGTVSPSPYTVRFVPRDLSEQ